MNDMNRKPSLPTNQQPEVFPAETKWEASMKEKVRQMLMNRSMVVVDTGSETVIIISDKHCAKAAKFSAPKR